MSFEIVIGRGEIPYDVCGKYHVSATEIAESLPSLSALYMPAEDPLTIRLRPQLSVPQFPVGARFVPSRLPASGGADFFDDVSDGDALSPPTPRIVPPLYRLATVVNDVARQSMEAHREHPEQLPSIEPEPLRQLKATIAAELQAAHLKTLKLSHVAIGTLQARHATDFGVPQGGEVVTSPPLSTPDGSVEGQTVLIIDVMERLTVAKPKERWAVLASQSFKRWFHSMACVSDNLPYPRGNGAFFFVGGSFYVEGDPARTCANIRDWVPPRAATAPFSDCPLLSMDSAVGDASFRINERGVLRHNGNCDHVFVVVSASTITSQSPDSSLKLSDFPRRLSLVPDRVTTCDVCRTLPATIMTYFDPLAPTHPALYCPACHDLLHGTEALDPDFDDGAVRFRLPAGMHF